MGRLSVLALTLCALLAGSAIAQASMADLYGEWTGTWYVDEKIDWNGDPFEAPPFPSVDFEVSLSPFDSLKNSYGVLSYGGIPGADVVALALNGTNVTMTLNYAPYSGGQFPDDPTCYALITGTFANGKITGNYDEAVPPPTSWISWCGPCEMTLVTPYVPEPATLGLIAMGALWLARRRRT